MDFFDACFVVDRESNFHLLSDDSIQLVDGVSRRITQDGIWDGIPRQQ